MSADERQRLIERLEEAEGKLDQAMQCIDVGKPQHAYWPVHEAHAELRAVRLAMQEAMQEEQP